MSYQWSSSCQSLLHEGHVRCVCQPWGANYLGRIADVMGVKTVWNLTWDIDWIVNTLSSSEHWHLDLGSMQNRHFPQPWLFLVKIQNSADLNNFQYCCELGCAVSIAHLSHTENWFQRGHCSGSEQFWNRTDSDQQPARGSCVIALKWMGSIQLWILCNRDVNIFGILLLFHF